MSKHTSAIVPLETWAFSSPELFTKGKEIDIGLFAESLIYYDTVYVEPGNPHFFSLFLKWFHDQGKLEEFRQLMNDGIIKIYFHSFMTTAIEKDGVYSIWNVQDEEQAKRNVFESRFLYNQETEKILPIKSRQRIKYYDAFRNNVVEAKSEAYSSAIEDARKDLDDAERSTLIIQSLVDEIYLAANIHPIPEIIAHVESNHVDETHKINWNIDFHTLSSMLGTDLKLHPGAPLTANAHSNRFIWSAASIGADLFLPRPMCALVGDKLFESTRRDLKIQNMIESLQSEVEFPSIRELVNSDILTFKDVMEIRKKAIHFRKWLQSESERDRNAIIAYHNELGKETGLLKFGRNTFRVFGVLGGGALGGIIGAAMAGPVGGALGGAAGSSLTFITEVCAKLGDNWKPVVFGNWLDNRIRKIQK